MNPSGSPRNRHQHSRRTPSRRKWHRLRRGSPASQKDRRGGAFGAGRRRGHSLSRVAPPETLSLGVTAQEAPSTPLSGGSREHGRERGERPLSQRLHNKILRPSSSSRSSTSLTRSGNRVFTSEIGRMRATPPGLQSTTILVWCQSRARCRRSSNVRNPPRNGKGPPERGLLFSGASA